jgi:hypothetical protein
MPRLQPGAPGLAPSPDHAWVAVVHGGKLTLVETATREPRATIELPFAGDTDVLLSREHLFAFVRLESSTACLVYTLPALEPVTSMELIGMATPLAEVHERLLVVGLNGELPRMITLQGKMLAADPIGLREPVQFAAEAPEDRLLVAARDQIECWDPLNRRALFRLHLPVDRPKIGGFSVRRRQLWVLSASPLGPMEVFRYSDGRLQARTELGKKVVAADGHPESPRLVVAAREGQDPIELTQFDLAIGERRLVPYEGTLAAFCVIDGNRPALVAARPEGTLDWLPLPQSSPMEEPPKPAAKRADAGSDKLTGWRDRLATEKPNALEAAKKFADRRRDEPKAVRPPPIRPLAQKPKPIERTAEAPVEKPPIEKSERPIERSIERSTAHANWRSALCEWAQHPNATAPPEPDDTLARAIARLGLSPGGARALALLYGQWLLGDGDRGVALHTLAQIAAGEGDDGWREALLQETLGRARICRVRGGRVKLREFAARFLDGRASKLQIVQPPAGATAQPLTTSHRIDGIPSPEDFAQKLARAIAVIPAGTKKEVEPQLAEARLVEAVPLVLGAGDDDWSELASQQILLVAVDEDAPLGLQKLPALD